MRLEAITTELRPRTAWEATDLGIALVQRSVRPVYAAWFAVALPVFILLHLVCWTHWALVPWFMWWLKPLLDRPPLYVLSHVLFDAPPTRQQFWRDLAGVLRRQALPALTWRRLDTARSFGLPIVQLEKLTGKAYRQRLRDLGRPGRGPAIWLTWICLHVEMALNFALVTLLWMLIPDFAKPEFFELFSIENDWEQVGINLVGFCGMSLVEPFYVAAGFTLYLNQRTWREAWDIELGFRRLAVRLAKSAVPTATGAVLLTLSLGMLIPPTTSVAATPSPASADHPQTLRTDPLCQLRHQREAELAQSPSPVKRALADTWQEPALQVCEHQEQWHWRDQGTEKTQAATRTFTPKSEGFATFVEYILWVGFGISLALLVWWLWRKAPLHSLTLRRRTPVAGSVPILGHNERFMSPPADVAETAWKLWNTGQPREALRLLYQASLAGLVVHYGLPLHPSTTEDDCLRVSVAHLGDTELTRFFRQLTRVWQSTAYAHRPPDDANARRLCEQWPQHFIPASATPP